MFVLFTLGLGLFSSQATKSLRHTGDRDAHLLLNEKKWIEHQVFSRIIDARNGKRIQPNKCIACNCLQVVINEDCNFHGLKPLEGKEMCAQAVQDVLPELEEYDEKLSEKIVLVTREVKVAPNCNTDGHSLIFNERKHNVYYKNGIVVDGQSEGAVRAAWDIACTVNSPCLCQYTLAHANASHTGNRVLCDWIKD